MHILVIVFVYFIQFFMLSFTCFQLLNTNRQNEAISFGSGEGKNFAKFPVSILDKLLLTREKVGLSLHNFYCICDFLFLF